MAQLHNIYSTCSMQELGELADLTHWMDPKLTMTMYSTRVVNVSYSKRCVQLMTLIKQSGAKAVIANISHYNSSLYNGGHRSVLDFFNSRISAESGLRATPLFTYRGNHGDDITCFRLEIIE